MATDFQVFSSDRYMLPTKYRRNSPWQYGKRHPRLQGSECFFPLPDFSFSYCVSFEGLVFRPRYRNCLLSQVYVSIRIHFPAADPRLSRHTEVYGGAVKRIDVAFQIKHFGRPLMSCFRYHVVGKILKDAVVSPLVCFG